MEKCDCRIVQHSTDCFSDRGVENAPGRIACREDVVSRKSHKVQGGRTREYFHYPSIQSVCARNQSTNRLRRRVKEKI